MTPPDRVKSPYEQGQQAAERGEDAVDWVDRIADGDWWEWCRGFTDARRAELRVKGERDE